MPRGHRSTRRRGAAPRIPTLPEREYRRLQRRARRAQKIDQSEVCGLVLIDGRSRLLFHFLENESRVPRRFSYSLPQVVRARRNIRGTGLRIFAGFHSHPIGTASPGMRDRRHAFYKGRELIYDVCGADVRLWRRSRRHGRLIVAEEPLRVVRSGRPVVLPS